jgi:hypothetical protein
MALFKRLSREDVDLLEEDQEPLDLSQVIEDNDDFQASLEEYNDMLEDLDEATEVAEEAQEKVEELETLSPEEYSPYVVRDSIKFYVNLCKRVGIEPEHISTEDIDNGIKLSVESIKETIIKIIEAIKAFIAKVWNALKSLFVKAQVVVNNDEKIAKEETQKLLAKIKEKNVTQHDIDMCLKDTSLSIEDNDDKINNTNILKPMLIEISRRISGFTMLHHNGYAMLKIYGKSFQEDSLFKLVHLTGDNIDFFNGTASYGAEHMIKFIRNHELKLLSHSRLLPTDYGHDIKTDHIIVTPVTSTGTKLTILVRVTRKESDYAGRGTYSVDDIEYLDCKVTDSFISDNWDTLSDINNYTINTLTDISRNIDFNKNKIKAIMSITNKIITENEKILSEINKEASDYKKKENLDYYQKVIKIQPRICYDMIKSLIYLNRTNLKIISFLDKVVDVAKK